MSFRILRVAALSAAVAAVSLASLAEGPAVCPPIDPPAPPAAGVRAAVDPVTGAVRPLTAEERSAAAARKRAAVAEARRNLQVVVHPNGMKTVDLGDAFLFDVVVETRPDGTLGYRCVPRSSAASAAKELR